MSNSCYNAPCIVLSMYVRVTVSEHTLKNTRQNSSTSLCMLPVAMTQSSYGCSIALSYAIQALWMTYCLLITGHVVQATQVKYKCWATQQRAAWIH